MGEWKEGKRDGQGVLIIADGSIEGTATFVGSFAEGRFVKYTILSKLTPR